MSLEALIGALIRSDADVLVTDVLDALWLATRDRGLSLHASAPEPAIEQVARPSVVAAAPPLSAAAESESPPREEDPSSENRSDKETPDARSPVYAPFEAKSDADAIKASPVSLPAGHALSGRLALSRALKPFRRRWPSQHQFELDEPLTAESTAALGGRLNPIFRPVHERWYDAEVVLEDDPAIELWRDTLRDFSQMLRDTGAFREVRNWRLRMPAERHSAQLETAARTFMPARTLPGHGTRQLVFFATHGSSSRWIDGSYVSVLAPWRRRASLVLLHLFDPERWRHCALGEPQALCRAQEPGAVTSTLKIDRFWWTVIDDAPALAVPIVPLAAADLNEWALMQMARGRRCPAVLLDPRASTPSEIAKLQTDSPVAPERAVALLRELSLDSFRLAVFLAAGPFTVSVARLVQEAKFGAKARQQHLADVLLSGLVFARAPQEKDSADPTDLYYEFYPAAREILLQSLREADAHLIAEALERRVSEHIESIQGRAIRFRALVADSEGKYNLPAWAQPFARLGFALLGERVQEQNPAQRVAAFRGAVSASSLGAFAASVASQGFEAGIEPSTIDPAVWLAARNARVVQQNKDGRWTFTSGVEAILQRIGVETPMLGLRLLWIDDNPANNESEAARFTALGAFLKQVTDAETGYELLANGTWDVIISDMARGSKRDAGVEFLHAMHRQDWKQPVIIYSGGLPARLRDQLMRAGAFGYANHAKELEHLILKAAGRLAPARMLEKREAITEALRRSGVKFAGGWRAIQESPLALATEILWNPVQADRAIANHLGVVQAVTGAHVVQLLTVAGSEMRVTASVLPDPGIGSYTVAHWGGKLVERAVKLGQVLWVPDLTRDADYIAAAKRRSPLPSREKLVGYLTGTTTRSVFVVPLFSQSDHSMVIGAVNIEMPDVDALSEQELRRVQELCAPLVVRLPKAQPQTFILMNEDTREFCTDLIHRLHIEGGISDVVPLTIWPDTRFNFSDTVLVVLAASTDIADFDFRLLQWDPALHMGRMIVIELETPKRLGALVRHVNVPVVNFPNASPHVLSEITALLRTPESSARPDAAASEAETHTTEDRRPAKKQAALNIESLADGELGNLSHFQRATQVDSRRFETPEFQAMLNDFSTVFLAEGDSWLGFGSTKSHNLLSALALPNPACVLNISHPGDRLRRMHETTRNRQFFFYLRNKGGRRWNAIFLSGGGNDLIDAVWKQEEQRSEILVKPSKPNSIDQTNLRSVINEDALDALFNFIKVNVAQIVAEGRDGGNSESKNVPVFMHTYAVPQPRNAPVRRLGRGPWLYPVCLWLGIEPALWLDLSRLLFEELAACMQSIDLPNFHIIDTLTLTTTLIPAAPGTTGDSNDWANEIHPNRRGYQKLANTWAAELARVLP